MKFRFISLFFLLLLVFTSKAETATYNPKTNHYKLTTNKVRDSIAHLLKLAGEHSYSDFSKASDYSEQAIQLADSFNLSNEHFQIRRNLAYIYENHNKLDSAAIYYLQGLEIAIKTNSLKNQLKAYSDLVIIYRRLANYPLSRDYSLKAMKIAVEHKNQIALENAYHGLGTTYQDVGDYENAIQNYIEAIRLTEKRKDTAHVVNTKQFLAIAYAESANTELALKTIREAALSAYQLKDTILMGIVAFDYGKILKLTGNTPLALEKFKESLVYLEYLQHKPLIVRSLFYLADIYTEEQNHTKAQEYFKKCIEYESFISKKGRADLYCKLGNFYHAKKEITKAIECYEESLLIAEESNFKEFCQKSNFGLYKIFKEKEDANNSLKYLEVYTAYKDTLLNEEKVKKIAELELKYDTEKTEKDLKDLKLQQGRFLIIGIIILFSCVSFFLIYNIRSTRKNNHVLRKKNVEIERKNVQLKESNEVLQQFTYVAAHDLKEPLRNISGFISLIQRKHGDNFNAEANEYMGFVTKAAHRMSNLLTALLEYSTISIQNPKQDLTNTKSVLKEVIHNLQYSIESKNAIIEYESYLPNLRINRLHLIQLFQNLISNSLQYSTEKPLIKINSQVSNNELRFEVNDNGKGIDDVHGNKIFNLFYQSDKNTDADNDVSHSNVGIGLTICKNIVDKYNGQIGFYSKPQKGTTFYFSFPTTMGV